MLQRALALRAEGKFKESHACLLQAADAGDMEAMYRVCADWNFCSDRISYGHGAAKKGYYFASVAFEGYLNTSTPSVPKTPIEIAYHQTRMLILDNVQVGWIEPLRPFVYAGNDLAQSIWIVYGCYFDKELALGHKHPYVCSRLGDWYYDKKDYDSACTLLQIAHDQGYYEASLTLYCMYVNNKRFAKAFEIVTESRHYNIVHNIISSIEVINRSYEEQYVIGRWRTKIRDGMLLAITQERTNNEVFWPNLQHCMNVYFNSNEHAQNASFCWMLCAKRLGIYKDIARIIGQQIWDSRIDPENWLKK
jgi:tetratricopeptide (TPR) repeat protein